MNGLVHFLVQVEFLPDQDDDAFTFFSHPLHGIIKRPGVVEAGPCCIENIPECVDHLDTNQAGLRLIDLTRTKGIVDGIGNVVLVGSKVESAVNGIDVFLVDHFDGCVVQVAVVDQVRDGANLDAMFFSKFFQLRALGHSAVFIHDLDNDSGGFVTGHTRKIATGFRMTGAGQDTAWLRDNREDMTGLDNIVGCGVFGCGGVNRFRPVGSRDTCRNSFGGFDGYGEIGFVGGAVLVGHQWQLQSFCPVFCDGQADQAAGVTRKKRNMFGRDYIGGDNKVAFVFAILVIHDQDHIAQTEFVENVFNGADSHFCTSGLSEGPIIPERLRIMIALQVPPHRYKRVQKRPMAINNIKFDREIRTICADVISDDSRLKVYEADGLTAKRQLPGLVVIPSTIEEVQQIVALCNRHGVPVVARGAGTGLSGGAMPHPEGVLLVLAKFNRILSIDETAMTAVVQPGVTNLNISEAVSGLGLFYAPDPSSQIACTIGGNVAENSGGVHCLKYGLTVHNVQSAKVVLSTGELMTVGGQALDAAGPDLLSLLHGSEGLLGIVVEVTVKLLPKPPAIAVLMMAFDSIPDAAHAVSAIIGSGVLPAGLEMMDRLAIGAAEAYIGAGYPEDAEALLLCELDGTDEEVTDLVNQVKTIVSNHAPRDVTVATDEASRQKLWQGRKAAFPAVGRIAPDYYCMDGTIPRRELADVLGRISELSVQYDLPVANVFHAGDGNLHPLILYDANKDDQLERAEKFGSDILLLCIERGGTITGEHGVGVEKINEMCVQFTDAERALFHSIKEAFDPEGILNPGKGVPLLSRCAEFGAMHVKRGEEKFPELDRF